MDIFQLSRDSIVAALFLMLSSCIATPRPNGPTKLGLIKLSDELDQVKPLATADFSGWIYTSNKLIGSPDGMWVAGIDVRNRSVDWWFKSKSELAAPITALGGFVLLGFRDGTMVKVDAATGKKIWQVTLDTFSSRRATLAGSTLLILSAGQQLYGVDYESGSTSWIYDAGYPDGLNLQGAAAPAADAENAYIGLANGEIHAVKLSSGKLSWRFDPGFVDTRFHDVMGTISIKGETLTISRYDGLIMRFSHGGLSRDPVWEERVSSVTSSTYRNGRYYVGCLNGDVIAYDIDTGKKLWTSVTGQAVTSITAGESAVFTSGGDGRINALSAVTGEIRWHDDIDAEVVSNPVVIDDGIFYSTGYKNLYGYKIDGL